MRSPTATGRRTSGCSASTSATPATSRCPRSPPRPASATTRLLGLKRLVEENLDEIDAAEINTFPLGHDDDGNLIVAKPGKYGPYVKRGEDTASVPDDLPPDELTVEKAIELLAAPKTDDPIGELDGLPVYAKNGRYGPYVQWGDHDNPPPGLEKPKMSSLFKTMVLERITMDEAEALLQLPRHLGDDPADGVPIYANNGRYGPYVMKEKDYRNIDSEDQLLEITLGRGAEDLQRAEGVQARRRQSGSEGSAEGVRRRSGQRDERSSRRTAGSACTSPTARRTHRSARATGSRR